jgi:hypothetical protein
LLILGMILAVEPQFPQPKSWEDLHQEKICSKAFFEGIVGTGLICQFSF